MIVDTSALVAYFNEADDRHHDVSRVLADTSEELVVSPFVVAELDYLVATRFGVEAEIEALRELTAGAWTLPAFDRAACSTATDVVSRYADQAIGLADASIIVLADRFGTRTVLTLDHRHFDVVRPLSGGRFRVLP